ncbi:MAG: hypothetical protein ACT4P3_01910, partial [Betaproteobacteria bacterium]
MAYVDLDAARKHCRDIRELVERHSANTIDYRALQECQRYCRGASSAVSDRECRERAGAVEDYACGLFAGTDYRKEILGELDALLSRLAAIPRQADPDAQASAHEESPACAGGNR